MLPENSNLLILISLQPDKNQIIECSKIHNVKYLRSPTLGSGWDIGIIIFIIIII